MDSLAAAQHRAAAATAVAPDDAGLDSLDLERYPLDRPESDLYAGRVAEARESLADDGCCVLPGLVRPAALAEMAAETRRLAPEAHVITANPTVYGGSPDESFPEGHPRRRSVARANGFVAADRIGPETRIRRLYEAPAFRAFVGACMGLEEIHPYADPLAQLVVNVLRPGAGHGWHFDTNEFAVSLLTQPPDAGGGFEYCPQIRSPQQENEAAVAAVLDGERGAVRRLELRPGDLQLFFGRYSLHRIAPVEGQRERHTVIFAYARRPGMTGNPEKTRHLFGRVTGEHAAGADRLRHDGLTD